MSLFRRALAAAGILPRLIGAIGGAWTWWTGILAGTRIDYQREVGRPQDNSVVSGGLNWLWKQTLYWRLIVEEPGEIRRGKRQWIEIPGHDFVLAWENGYYYDDTVLKFGSLLGLLVDGNAYLEKIRSAAGIVVGFALLPTRDVEVCNDRNNRDGTQLITHYVYRTGGLEREIEPANMEHLRWGWDSERPGMGLSPLYAALRDVYGENQAATLTAALLRNGGIVALAFSPKESKADLPKDPEQKERFKSLVQRAITGDRAGEPLMFPFPVDVHNVGHSPDKLVIDRTRAIQVSRICMCLGIDPMVLGLPSETKTYSNYEESVEAAIEGTVQPLLKLIATQLTRSCLWLDFGEAKNRRIGWDASEVPALQDDEDKLFTRAATAYKADLVTLNEAREIVKYDQVPGGDVFYSDKLQGFLAAGAPAKAEPPSKAMADARRARLESGAEEDDE